MNVHPEFERFERATDAHAVTALLPAALERSQRVPVEIVSAVMPRAFPRHGGGFTMQYRVMLKRPGARAAEPMWLCGHLLGPDEAWPRYARAAPDTVIVAPELRLVVPLFPYDPKLRVLPELVDPERVRPLLREVLPPQVDASEGHIEIGVLGYRLERRCVVHYRIRPAKGVHVVTAVATAFRPSRSVALRRTLEFLRRSPLAEFLPRTWGVDEIRGIHWMESVPAPPLHALLETRPFVEGCQEAARALRTMHRQRPVGLPRVTATDTVGELRQVLAHVKQLFPEWSADFDGVQVALAANAPSGPAALCCIHHDFHDKQVLYAPSRTTLLDCENMAAGDAAQDFGNFVAHFFLRRLQEPNRDALLRNGASAFRAAYGATSSAFDRRASWWQSATLLRLAALYSLRPRWRHLTEPLLEQAQRLLLANALRR